MNPNLRTQAAATAVILTLVAGALPATAAVVIHDATAFNASLQGGASTEDFSGFAQADITDPIEISENGFEYSITSTFGGGARLFVTDLGGGNGNFLNAFNGNQPITIDFTSGNVTAVGGEFFATKFDGGLVFTAGTFTLNLSDGTDEEVTIDNAGDRPFVGFLSSVPITSLVVNPTGEFQEFSALDNLAVGAAVVPEPIETTAFVAAGLLALGGLRRYFRVGRRDS